ncbi:Adprhl2 protein [Vibrio fluvialis PG41]|uniref:Adprhl2 protein n=1 Tax=Vibrio fluvialis PG41 TaxID=1336752 RepID=S7HVG9_VIBFL|nr:ADP-ribosylglycohydrolase family protein [Vibrio fluvialis]EPP19724.1 Adprhl2 protein [Vibrio fluvialis PG41]
MKNKALGVFVGLAIGDAYGAKHEGGVLERLYWKFVSKTSDGKIRYTDDTEMSIALARSLIKEGGLNLNNLALEFANGVTSHRGYGQGARKVLKKIRKGVDWKAASTSIYPSGSYGNGSAMRTPLLAVHFNKVSDEKFREIVDSCSSITHTHHFALEGARLIGFCVRFALNNDSNEKILEALLNESESNLYKDKLTIAKTYIENNQEVDKDTVAASLGNGIIAQESVVTAIYYALRFRELPLMDMLDAIYMLGGDTDTIGSMAGSIWGALNGYEKIEPDVANQVEYIEGIKDYAEGLI